MCWRYICSYSTMFVWWYCKLKTHHTGIYLFLTFTFQPCVYKQFPPFQTPFWDWYNIQYTQPLFYHQLIRPRPKSFMAPIICITAGISSSGDNPILEERRRSAGPGPPAVLLALPAASLPVSEVVVAVNPFTLLLSCVKVNVRTLKRTCNRLINKCERMESFATRFHCVQRARNRHTEIAQES